jgi:DNA uptake protein ComE-like DNA-binding protein
VPHLDLQHSKSYADQDQRAKSGEFGSLDDLTGVSSISFAILCPLRVW